MTSQTVVGLGATFFRAGDPGTEFEVSPGVFERIAPDAFTTTLASKENVRVFFNHDPSQILGTTAAGTARLWVRSAGLFYGAQLPDSPLGQTVGAAVARGDVAGSSFTFIVEKQSFHDERRDGRTITVRTLLQVSLVEVGPVTFPAYEATSAKVT